MKSFIFLGFVLLSFLVKAQEEEKVSVNKNLYGVQLGIVNSSFYYETKLDRKIALRGEAGLELLSSTIDYVDPAMKDETTSFISPYLSLEPRWYYGIDRRARLKKNIKNNSSNYVSLRTSYFFTDASLTNTGNFDIDPSFWIVPKFGIRRVFAKHFNYEVSGGMGYQYSFFSDKKYVNGQHSDIALDFQIRIGYDF